MSRRSLILTGVLLILTAALFVFSTACTSTPNKKTIFIPEYINRIYIFNFLNNTKNRTLPGKIIRELEKHFGLSKEVSVSSTLKGIQAVIEGRITRLFFQPVTYTDAGRVDKARYYLEIEFSFRDTVKKKYILRRQKMSVYRSIRFFTSPISDMVLVLDSMVEDMAKKILNFCVTGLRVDFNVMYGYENKTIIEDDGTLIGKTQTNYDKNNDGIDDRYQNLTNSDGLTNVR